MCDDTVSASPLALGADGSAVGSLTHPLGHGLSLSGLASRLGTRGAAWARVRAAAASTGCDQGPVRHWGCANRNSASLSRQSLRLSQVVAVRAALLAALEPPRGHVLTHGARLCGGARQPVGEGDGGAVE